MYKTTGSNDTFAFGCALGSALLPGDTVLLYGDLGTGKSVLARGAARALGVTEEMASPTFTLMQPYKGESTNVYHFDLYRLSDADELFASGLEDHIASDGVALVEWPQQADLSPDVRVEIDLMRTESSDEREIDVGIFGFGAREAQIREALKKWEAQ